MKLNRLINNRFVLFYNNLEIKKKLFLVNSCSIILGIVLSLAVLDYGLTVYDNILYKEASQTLNISTISIENELKQIENLSSQIMSDNIIQDSANFINNNEYKNGGYAKVALILQRFQVLSNFENNEFIKSLIFVDNKGKSFAIGNEPSAISSLDKKNLISQTQRLRGKNIFTKSHSEKLILLASRLIRKKENLSLKSLGFIVIKVDFEKIIKKYIDFLPYKINLVFYLKNDVIYSSNNTLNIHINDLKTRYNQGYTIQNINNNKFFIAYSQSNYTNWKCANLIAYNSIFNKAQYSKKILISFFILIFFIVIFISNKFASSITNPIKQLTKQMKKAEKGIFDFTDIEHLNITCDNEILHLQRNFNYMMEKINYLINEIYKKQITIKDTQLRSLQAQINPHFLYNTLESINWLAKINNMQTISTMVESLGMLLRNSLNNKNHLIDLEEEIKLLECYIKIQKTRYENSLDFKILIDKSLFKYKVPKLILQPLIENSINYGFEKVTKVEISLSSQKYNDYFQIFVEDNGPGISEDDQSPLLNSDFFKPKGLGTGLKNINERIKLIFGEKYGLAIENSKKGSKITISTPYF